ncbi:uncharacterized protein Smp_200440 [Schistosoma mansoni]|uniref:uncharacterized protein n=1 Tax=Schistosoma mansoni TaxID=6183 RepID=UPI00022DC975|nr:uncharacterized protein Smp_200440 [Schistosoma mansoni]|eukprot:XP_018647716.1 uncharacterized protein Smp_200440 [Schistosoma mansoni]
MHKYYHYNLCTSKKHLFILTTYVICTILCINSESLDDSSLLIDFPCGPHPIDMFLSKLFDYLEKQETPIMDTSETDEKLHIKMIYGKLLYAFTPMPRSSYYVYNEIMRSINGWNECMSKQPRLKKWLKRRNFLQNVNTIVRPNLNTDKSTYKH